MEKEMTSKNMLLIQINIKVMQKSISVKTPTAQMTVMDDFLLKDFLLRILIIQVSINLPTILLIILPIPTS